MEFTFDYCYWSVDSDSANFATQELVYQDLGTSVLSGAIEGYNVCLFAYGQTGSGKTYTMMGTPASIGLTPRICKGLFSRVDAYQEKPAPCSIEVSFLEIYNERVRDLLKRCEGNKPYTLRVREHPEKGPYVQGLSQHLVSDYKQLVQLLEEGIANRITAATHIHDASSRSHAIFTIHYTQAILENNLPSEIVSKINLVDLAGSERADPNYSKDRITEGSNINKSLVTLGIVISTLAQNSQISSSFQSINTVMSEGDSGSHSSASSGSSRRQCYVPYRDSVLTWLLKDSLGGNSKTIMIATISPASTSYTETISTLRYAAHAKNIVNKPHVNEDANVKLIRELREEIDRLKSMLMSFGLRNLSPLSDENDEKDGSLTEILLQNELKVDQLTKDWTDRWKDTKAIMEEYYVDINRRKTGVIVASQLPHLIAVDEDILSTGVCLYYLREGITKIGRINAEVEQDIVLQGPWVEKEHCIIRNDNGVVILEPIGGSQCIVNELDVVHACHLSQGAVIVLGKVHKFRFNHPNEAAKLRQRRASSSISLASSGSCEWLDLDGEFNFSPPYVLSPLMQASLEQEKEEGIEINETRRQLKELRRCYQNKQQENEDYKQKLRGMEMFYQQQIRQQQSYVEELRQHIQATDSQAEQELKHDQEQLRLRIEENEQHLTNEEKRLVCLEQQRQELGIQTDSASFTECGVQISSQVEEIPFIEQNRKRLVQLELLQRHTLRKAEQNIHKKRIRYQLESIAERHKLLEAKANLRYLETASLITRKQCRRPIEGTLQTDVNLKLARWNKSFPVSYLPLRRHSLSVPFLTRRHSDSSDLVSHLYPQHVPVYSDFLKRKNLSTSAHCTTQKSLSVGSLSKMAFPVTRTQSLRGRSEKVSPSWDQLQKKHKGVKHKNIIALKQSTENNEMQPKILELSSVQPEVQTSNISKTRVQKSGLMACSLDNQSITDKQLELTDEDVKKDLSWNCTFVSTSSNICKRTSPKQLVRTGSFCRVNQSEHLNKEASVVNLAHLWENMPCTYRSRKWNSDEILNASITAVPDDSLGGWLEEEQLSDTDSLYSVDSLSSAITEQLQKDEPKEQQSKHENCSESDESEMSQDSLAEKDTNSADRFHDIHCARAHLSHNKTTNRRKSISLDNLADLNETSVLCRMGSPGLTASDEMPAEVYWNLPWSEVEGKKTYQNSKELIEEKECVGALTLKEQCFNVGGNTELKDIKCEKNIPSKNLKTNKNYMDFPIFTDAQSFFESNSKSKMERVSSDNASVVAISSGDTDCYENVGTELMKAAEASWISSVFNFDQLQPRVLHNFDQVTEHATYKECHASQNANNQGVLHREEDSAQIQEISLSPFATGGVTVQSSQCTDHNMVCVTGVLSTAEMKVKHSLTNISPVIANVSDNTYSAQQSCSQTESEDLILCSTSNTLKLETFSTDAAIDMNDADLEIEVSEHQCKDTESAKNCSQSQHNQLSNSDYHRNDGVHVSVSEENAAKLNFSSTFENTTTSGREQFISLRELSSCYRQSHNMVESQIFPNSSCCTPVSNSSSLTILVAKPLSQLLEPKVLEISTENAEKDPGTQIISFNDRLLSFTEENNDLDSNVYAENMILAPLVQNKTKSDLESALQDTDCDAAQPTSMKNGISQTEKSSLVHEGSRESPKHYVMWQHSVTSCAESENRNDDRFTSFIKKQQSAQTNLSRNENKYTLKETPINSQVDFETKINEPCILDGCLCMKDNVGFSEGIQLRTSDSQVQSIVSGTLSYERGELPLKDKSLEKLSASANNPNREDNLNYENTLFLSGTQDQKCSILAEETSILSLPVTGQNIPSSISEQPTGSTAGIWNTFNQDSNIVVNSDKLPNNVNFSAASVSRHHLSQCLTKMTEQINKQVVSGSGILLGSNTHRSAVTECGVHRLEISIPQDTKLGFRTETDRRTLDKEKGVIQNNIGTELRVEIIEGSNTRAVEFTGDNISTLASTCGFEDCPTVSVSKGYDSQSKFKNNMIINAFKGDLPKTDSSLPVDLTERSVTMGNAGFYKGSKECDVGIEEQMDDKGTSQNVPLRTAHGTGATLSDVECDQKEITCVELTQRDNIAGDCPEQYKSNVNSRVVQVINSSGATHFQRTSVQNGRFSVTQTDAPAGTSSTDLADSSETCGLSDAQEIRTMCGTKIGNEQNEINTTQHVIVEKLSNNETKAFEKGTEIEGQGVSENFNSSKYCAEQTCIKSFIIENDCIFSRAFREKYLSSICTCTETSGGAGASKVPLQGEIIGTDHEAGETKQENPAVAQNFLIEIPNSAKSVDCENVSNNEEQKVSPEELQLIKKSNPATFQEMEIFESVLCQESTDQCEASLTTARCDVALHSLRGHKHSQVGRLENSGIMDSRANPGSPSNGITAASTKCDVSNTTSIHCLVPVEYSPLREKQNHRLATESLYPELAESRAITDGYMCSKGIALLQHSDQSPSLPAGSPHDTAPLEPNKDTVEREGAIIGVEAPASCFVLKAGPEANGGDGGINQSISSMEEYSTHPGPDSALPNQDIVLKEVIGRHVIWCHPDGTAVFEECEFQDDRQMVDLHLGMLGPQYLKTGIETIVNVKQKYPTSKTVSSGENIANVDIADATVSLNICKGPTCLQFQNTGILATGLNIDPSSQTFQDAVKTDDTVVCSNIPTTSTLPPQSKVFQNQTVFQGSSVQDVSGSRLSGTPQTVPDSFADQPDALDVSSCISSGTVLLKQEGKQSQIAIVHTATIQTALVEDDTKTTIVPGSAGLSSLESKLCAEGLKITPVTKNQVPIQQGLEQVVHMLRNGSPASNLKKTEAKCHDVQFSNSDSVNTFIPQSFIKSSGHHKQAGLHNRREEDYSICFNDRDPGGLELTGNSSSLFVTPEQQTAVHLVNYGEEFVTFEFMALPKAVKCDMNYNENDIFDSTEDLIRKEESGIEDCEEAQALLKGDLTDFKEMSSDVDCHNNNQRILIDIKKEGRSQFPPKIQKNRCIGLSPSAREILEQEKPRLLQQTQNHIIPQCEFRNESRLLRKDWNNTRITHEATETRKQMSSHISDLQVTQTDYCQRNIDVDEPNTHSLLECKQVRELGSPFCESNNCAEMDGTCYFSNSYLFSGSCHSDWPSVNQVNEPNIEGIESSGSESLDGSDDRCAPKMMNGPKKKSQRRLKRIKPNTDEIKVSSSSSEEIDIEFLSLNKLRSRQCRRGINRSDLNVCKCKDMVSTNINFESCALNFEMESKASPLRLLPSVLQEASPSVNHMMEGSSGHCLDPLLIDKPSEGLTPFVEGIVYQMRHETEDVERKHQSQQCFRHNIAKESVSECADLHVATCAQTVHSPITLSSNQGQRNQSDKQLSEDSTSLTINNNLSNSAEAKLKAQEFSVELTLSEEKGPVHFACSDVDPYIHEQCKAKWKQFRLGNTGTVHEVRTAVSNVMKCFSDNNGSNDHNHNNSHSYANERTISNTLLPNDSQEASLAAMYPGNDNLDGDSCVMSCDQTMAASFTQPSQFPTSTSESENVNYQVDEIMLLYPRNLGSSVEMMSDESVKFSCNKETQTSGGMRHQEQPTPQRSCIQTPAQITAGQSFQPDMIKLLHSSTELLGSIRNNEDYSDPLTNQSAGKMRVVGKVDGHTQSAADVATQTDAIPQAIEKYSQEIQNKEVQRPQEVNVIVKIIGSEVNVNQDHNNIMLTLQEPKQNHRVSDLNVHRAALSHSVCSFPSDNVNSSFRTSVLLPAQKLITSSSQTSSSSPSLSLVTVPSQISMNSDQTQSTSFGTLESTSEFSKVETNDPKLSVDREVKQFAQGLEATVSTNKNPAVLVDRASSPIKTLEVGQGDHRSHCRSFLCLQGEEICALQQTDCWQRKAQLASWYGSDENGQSKIYFTHVKPKAEQILETNGEGLLVHLNEQSKITSQGLPMSVKLECKTDLQRDVHTEGSSVSSGTAESCKDHHVKVSTVNKSSWQCGKALTGHIVKESLPCNKGIEPYLTFQKVQRLCTSNPDQRKQMNAFSFQPSCWKNPLVSFPLAQINDTEWPSGREFPVPCSASSFQHNPFSKDGVDLKTEKVSALHNQTIHRSDSMNQCSSEAGTYIMSEMTNNCVAEDTQSSVSSECNTDLLLNEYSSITGCNSSQTSCSRVQGASCSGPEDLPLHNKFYNWSGVNYRPPSTGSVMSTATSSDRQSEQKQANIGIAETMGLTPEDCKERWKEIKSLRQERTRILSGLNLDLNQHQLTVELAEAKLNYGLGETDALLRILHSGAADDQKVCIRQQLYERHMKTIEILRKERDEKTLKFRRTRSLSPQKHLTVHHQKHPTALHHKQDLPSKRRTYLQRLRQDIVENTRTGGVVNAPQEAPSEIETLLRDYQKAREETKAEIAKARDKLRARAEKEKCRLQQEMILQLLKEEERLRKVASRSSLHTGSNLSLSSNPTSGYSSSNTASPDINSQTKSKSSTDPVMSSRGQTSCCNSQYKITEVSQDFDAAFCPLAHSISGRIMKGSCHSSSTCLKQFQDLATLAVASVTAEIMVASVNHPGNLLIGKAAAGWRYHSTEKGVLMFYKPYASSTKHGFMGIGVIDKPLHSVWCVVKDNSKRQLYDKTLKTVKIHQQLGHGIELVYLVMDTAGLNQPRDFCCISVEAERNQQYVLALNSIYEESMPRPVKDMVRGEMLPSGWILQPDNYNGKEITRLIYLTQVDLGAPALHPRLLGSLARQQPLCVANLVSLLS
ncbi:stAR-related lipid transfer protein 9-like isoform X3 [Mobula birostris]